MKKWYLDFETLSWMCPDCAIGIQCISDEEIKNEDLHTDQDIPCSGCWDDPKQTLIAQFNTIRDEAYSSDLGKSIEIARQLLNGRTQEHEKPALKAVLAAASKQLLQDLSGGFCAQVSQVQLESMPKIHFGEL